MVNYYGPSRPTPPKIQASILLEKNVPNYECKKTYFPYVILQVRRRVVIEFSRFFKIVSVLVFHINFDELFVYVCLLVLQNVN